ncbi:hypothetical protein K402DRAFT_452267 [Aulographum hederae CBS 113979]|uniref:Protein kinase domain-containing protein n=1 Tax=Aulographum hederae CBS 113979 TaxID=1176131 RepID=A0A6G1H746_9PEZI|nr:hypothetical protein K402DRAFT_452267 [Aulographum hederae CBS 113979]
MSNTRTVLPVRNSNMLNGETAMHEGLEDCPHIRKQNDRANVTEPLSRTSGPSGVVLEPMEMTLVEAVQRRTITEDEIRVIMTGALHGLAAIHDRGLVYRDFKTNNIYINGFRDTPEATMSEESLIAMIGDLENITRGQLVPGAPSKDMATPAANIWSWGSIMSRLLEAEASIASPSQTNSEDLRRHSIRQDAETRDTESLPHNEEWLVRLRRKGVAEPDISFLSWVLHPDPTKRPDAKTILTHPQLAQSTGCMTGESANVHPPERAAAMAPNAFLEKSMLDERSLLHGMGEDEDEAARSGQGNGWTDPMPCSPLPTLPVAGARRRVLSLIGLDSRLPSGTSVESSPKQFEKIWNSQEAFSTAQPPS